MAQISVGSLNCERVILVVDIIDVFSGKDHIQIPNLSICAVPPCFRSPVRHALDRLRSFIQPGHMPHDLPWAAANHRYDIDILPSIRMRLLLQEPIQFIHFHDLMLHYGRVLSVQLYDRSFLSNFGQFFHASSLTKRNQRLDMVR